MNADALRSQSDRYAINANGLCMSSQFEQVTYTQSSVHRIHPSESCRT